MQRTVNHALAAVAPVARRFGAYTAYQLEPPEYVGTVAFGMAATRQMLELGGYEPNPLSAAKYHPEPHKAVDHGSYRRVPDSHPPEVEDTDPTPELAFLAAPRQCQYHVHLWPCDEGTAVFSHYETRPDLHPVGDESLTEAYCRLREHFRPTHGETYLHGVTDLEL